MHKSVMFALLLFSHLFLMAQYPGYSLLNQPEAVKKSFAGATAATESISCNFVQEKSLSMLSEKLVSSGKFWYQKKDKLRMEYTKPYAYLMILRDGKIFIRDGKNENKISANSNKLFQQVNRILIDCVSGRMLDNPSFSSRIFSSSQSFLIELSPLEKNLKQLYRNINIVIEKKNYSATDIEMYELSGDKTIIRFTNKEINVAIPEEVFSMP